MIGEPPGSVRVFATGATGSGKTRTLTELWAYRAPRLLVLDTTGEHRQLAGAIIADDWGELRSAFARVAGRQHWRIVASLDDRELIQLAALLLPEKRARERSLSTAFGGMALYSDEVAHWAHHGAPAEYTNLWRRGRHVGLSIFAATQRPADCHRIVTSQSRWLAVCALHEPNDLAWLRGKLPADVVRWLDQLPRFGCILWNNERRAGALLDARRRIIARFGPR